MHCSITVYVFKNIKNGFYGIIYTFKNYFATLFSVFNFSKNKLYSNGPLMTVTQYSIINSEEDSFY